MTQVGSLRWHVEVKRLDEYRTCDHRSCVCVHIYTCRNVGGAPVASGRRGRGLLLHSGKQSKVKAETSETNGNITSRLILILIIIST